ncbi:MAG: hypothetical protein CMH57_07925 [Myxococcales bacterium]|nr:hypothetical protein [Myxococcales bacterium]
MDRTVLSSLVVGATMTLACVEQEPYPYAAIYDPPLRPIAAAPDPESPYPVATNQRFRIAFNTYLDAERLTAFSGLGLRSGGVRGFGLVRYEMVDKTLVWTTTRPLEPTLLYQLIFDDEALRSVTGQPYSGPLAVPFLVGDYEQLIPDPEPAPTWSDVEPILAPCNDCHADPSWLLRPIDFDHLVAQPSDLSEDRILVIPYNAPGSYLMHVILWDYPLRDVTAQPPSWAGYPQLSLDDQRTIERWIRGGATR